MSVKYFKGERFKEATNTIIPNTTISYAQVEQEIGYTCKYCGRLIHGDPCSNCGAPQEANYE